MRPSLPRAFPSPDITTHADPLAALPLRTFLASTLALPFFMAPHIIHAAPRWLVRVINSRMSAEVSASSRLEAKFAGAKALGVHVQSLLVSEAYDPLRFRFGKVA